LLIEASVAGRVPPRSKFLKTRQKSACGGGGLLIPPISLPAGATLLLEPAPRARPPRLLGMAGIGGRRKADQGGGRPVTPWPPAVRWCR